ncbi:hypothetical protein NDU88_002065 [Pleurodeles waltl]|uniref:Uncharacterized protein n=1 Tax=Pleurodeles waltl TaxID=8319 RepID=A0AAV7LBA1_PLEWA|nr:hypothetical protein NDU88_002065 [Pleurodeles waltl]
MYFSTASPDLASLVGELTLQLRGVLQPAALVRATERLSNRSAPLRDLKVTSAAATQEAGVFCKRKTKKRLMAANS